MRLIYAYLASVLASRQLPHIYQYLYHNFSQRPSHHQEDMDRDIISTQMKEGGETSEAANLSADEAAVRVVKEATEEEAKEIKIKVKMELTEAIGMGKKNGHYSAAIINTI